MTAASWVCAAFAATAALVSGGFALLARHYKDMAQEALAQVKAFTQEPHQ
jgi:hypothetical protein